jgi:hypothetical protein
MNSRVGLLGLLLVVTSLVACTKGGFRAAKPQSATFSDKVAPPQSSVIAQSPRITAVKEAAKKEKIQVDNDGGPADADTVLGVSLRSFKDKSQAETRALINLGGQKMMFKGTLSTAIERDGKAVVITDFSVDDTVENVGKFEKTDVHYDIQAISHCANQCLDVLIQIQLHNNGKVVASPYYNFRLNEKGEYEIVNSTVETRYLNAEQALAKAKEAPASAGSTGT